MIKEDFVFQVLAPNKTPVMSIGMTREAVVRLKDAVTKTLERPLEKDKIGIIALQLDDSKPGGSEKQPKTAFELLGGK